MKYTSFQHLQSAADFYSNMGAAPTYGAGGEIIDGGADLGQAGFTAYYFDAIYIGIAVQLGSILSDWFWLLFLAVSSSARAVS